MRKKKVSPFLAYLLTGGVIVVGIMLAVILIIFLSGQVSEQGIKKVTIEPQSCAGWNNAEKARSVDQVGTAPLSEFAPDNSAYVFIKNAQGESEIVDSNTDQDEHAIVCSGFAFSGADADTHELRDAELFFSLAGLADHGLEDVVSLSYSFGDNQWIELDSLMVDKEFSNKLNGGYWNFSANEFLSLENLDQLSVRITYHAKSIQGSSQVFLDGVNIEVDLQKKVAIPPLPEDMVKVAKLDFSLSEEPDFAITVEDKSFWTMLGQAPDRHVVKHASIHHVAQTARTADFRVETVKEGLDTTEHYVFTKENFTKPGLYVAEFEIEKDGVTQTVQREFLWGVIAMNVRTSISEPNAWTEVGLAVLDENGRTLCDAPLEATVTYPSGHQKKFSRGDTSIVTNETCADQSVTNNPDYLFLLETLEEGTYQIEARTQTPRGEFVHHDSIEVKSDAPFDVERTVFPTRIFPVEDYPVSFTITPRQDYAGTVTERVPHTFLISDITDGGVLAENVGHGQTEISWQVDWKAGQTYTLGYTMDPPNVSPEYFLLGPLGIGDFSESRKWQIASDIVGGQTAADTQIASSYIKQAGEGRHMVYTSDTTVYLFYIDYYTSTTTTGYVSYLKSTNGGIDWDGKVNLTTDTDIDKLAVWYDKWTPGNTGDLIHIAYLKNGNDSIYYENIDTANSDTQKGEVQAYYDSSTARTYSTDSFSITRATDGDLYFAVSSSSLLSTAVVRKSDDTGSTWSTVADEGLDDEVGDKVLVMPLANADILLARWDISAEDIQTKEYEDVGDSWTANWTTTQVDTSAADSTTYTEAWGATIDSSFNIYMAYVNTAGGSADVKTSYYDGSSWTAKTSVVTATTSIVGTAIALDSNTNDVYVAYIRGSAGSVNNVYYKVSSDTMGTWTSERGAVLNIDDDMRHLHMNIVDSNSIGVMTHNDDLDDLWFGRVVDLGTASGSIESTNFSGFESGDAVDANATSGTFEYSTAYKRTGEYAFRSYPTSSTGYADYPLSYAATGAEDTTVRDSVSGVIALRVETTPSAETTVLSVHSTGTVRFELTMDTSRNINLTGSVSGTYALSLNTWYIIAFTINSDTDIHHVGIYNTDMTTRHELLNSTSAISNFNFLRVGVSATSTTADLYYDDLMLFASSTVSNFPYISSNYKIMRMDSNAVGTETAWTGDYTAIDEIPTSTADYINISGSGDETSNLESTSTAGISGSILSVRVLNTAWEASSCTSSVNAVLWGSGLGATETSSVDLTTTSGTEYVNIRNIIPNEMVLGSNALFTTSNLDSAEYGISANTTTCELRNGSMVVQVAYVAPVTPDISGSLYSDEGSTKITASAKTIHIAVNGSTAVCGGSTCTAETSSGDWSIADVTVASAGDVITVYVDDETENAVTVTRAASTTTDITGLDLYQNHVIVRHEDSGPITNANLDQYDGPNEESGDGDIGFTVTTNALTTDSGWELFVWAGDTYDPNGTVTTNATGGDFDIRGTAYLDTATSTIGNQILLPTGGSLTISADTSVSNATESIFMSGGTLAISGGETTIAGSFEVDSGTATITSGLTMTSSSTGDLDNNGGTVTIDTGGDVTLGRELCNHTGATFNFDGGTTSGSNVSGSHFRFNGGTVNLRGGTHSSGTDSIVEWARSTTSGCMNDGSRGAIEFNMIDNNPDPDGIIETRQFLAYSSYTLTTSTVTGGTLKMGTGTTSPQWYDVNTSTHEFYNLEILRTCNMQLATNNHMDLAGSLTIHNGVTWTGNSYPITVDGDLIIDGTYSAGTSTITVGGNWTNNNTFTAGSGTVVLTGTNSVSKDINGSADTTFYNLNIGNASTTNTVTIGNGTDDPQVSNNLTIDTGDILSINTDRFIIQQNGSGSMTFNGTINGPGRFTYQDATTFPSTGTLGSTLDLRFDATSSDLAFSARTFPCIVTLYTNYLSGSRTITAGAGTSVFQNTVTLVSASGQSLVVDFDTNAQTNLEFDGDITIGADTTFEAASETTIFDTMTFTDNGTFAHNNGTIDFRGINCYIEGTSDTTFYDVAITTSFSLLSVGDYGGTNDPVVSNSLTMGASTSFLVTTANRTFTVDSTASMTFPSGAGIDGTGLFIYKPSAAFPTGGVLATGTNLRYDSSDNSQTMSARAYYNVEIYGNNSSNSVTAAAGSHTINGTLETDQDGAGTTTFNMDTNDPSITINGDFIIRGGTYIDEGSGTIDLNGDLTKEAVTTWSRNTSGGTLLLSGSALQTIDATGGGFVGGGALYNLTITNNSGSDPQSDPSVKFLGSVSVYGTYTITTGNVKVQYDDTGSSEVINVNWNSSDANKIYFRSTSAGTQFELNNFDMTDTVNDVDAKDAYNNGSTVFNATDASNVNSGNTYQWDFGSTLLTGTVYSNLTGSAYNCSSNNLTINVSVNGDATPDSGTCTAANGTFSFSVTQPTAANQFVATYIDGAESVSATTATLTEGQYYDISTDLYIDYVAIDSDSGTTMTNTYLDTFDSGNDSDVDYLVTGTFLTVSSGHGLYVAQNYTPGGATVTPASSANAGTMTSGGDGDVVIASSKTLNVGTNGLSIGGDFDNNGTYTTSATHVTTFTGTTTGFTLDSGGSILRDVVFNGSGGGWSFITDTSMINGTTLTMTNGTLSGTTNLGIGQQGTESNIVCGATCGTINLTGGTVYLYGEGDITNNADWSFYNLYLDHTTTNNYTTTASGTGKITITGTLTLDDSTFPTVYRHSLDAGSKVWEFTGAIATPFDNRGYLIGNSSTFTFKNTGTVTIAHAEDEISDYYYNVVLQPASSSSYSLEADDYWVKGDWTMTANTNLDPSTSTVYFPDDSTLDGGGQKLYDVYTWDMGGVTLSISNSDAEISGTYIATPYDTISIDSGRTLTMSGPEMQIYSGNTVSGAGTLRFVAGAGGPGTAGTVSVDVQFDATNGSVNDAVDPRTYGGDVQFYSSIDGTRSIITLAAGTYNFSGNVTITHGADGCGVSCGGYIRLTGVTNDPTVNVAGDLDFGPNTDTVEYVYTGSGVWTVSGNVDTVCDEFFGINTCYTTETGNTFIMDGTSKTLASMPGSGEHFYDLEFAGSTTLVGDLFADRNLTITGAFTSSNGTVSVGNTWDNDGTFTHGSGTVQFTGTAGSITGSSETAFYNLTIDPSSTGTITQSTSDISVAHTMSVALFDAYSISSSRNASILSAGALTLTGTISGDGVLDYQSSTVFPSTGTISSYLRMNPRSNNQTMPPRTYGGGVLIECTDSDPAVARTVTVNAGGALTVSGNLDLTDGTCSTAGIEFDLSTNNPTTVIAGNRLSIDTGTEFSAPASLELKGSYVQTGTGAFTDNSGTVTLSGTGAQGLSGDMTGSANDFYDLIITNAGASNPDIIFENDADVTNDFTATTASTQIQFLAGGDYTLYNIDLNGQASGTRVALTSSSSGTAWNVTSEGSRSVSYTSVKDSNACPSSTDIDASNGTNFDNTGNTCWIFSTVAFSISDVSVYFGNLNPSSACFAQGSDPGGACSGSEGEAHQLVASTGASSGYVITVFGVTLTSDGKTITAIGGSNTASNPGNEQFGLRMNASGGSGSVSAPYAASGFAYDAESAPDIVASSATASEDTTYSVRYIGNISSATDAGLYTTGLTYVVTPLF